MPRMPFLTFLSGPSAGIRCEVLKTATLGRSRACEVPIEDERVSRQHARISVEEGRARLRDLGSRNGTVLNGRPVAAEVELLSGDLLQLGDTLLRYEVGPAASIEGDSGELRHWGTAELLPSFEVDGLPRWANALISSQGEAGICRTAADELGRIFKTARCLALLESGRNRWEAVAGTQTVQVPQYLIHAALDRAQVCRVGRLICFPMLGSNGTRMGALCAEREEEPSQEELAAGAILGRLAGEALAAARQRSAVKSIALVGTTAVFRETVKNAERGEARSQTVLLYGEHGSGKAFLAEYLHSRSARARSPCVTVLCTAEPERLEAELTDAWERAEGGTLILRHIELAQNSSARRLSQLLANTPPPGRGHLDVHLVATAARRLEVLPLQAGASIEVPPLRNRSADVAPLFKAFATAKARDLGVEPARLSQQAQRLLAPYRWPGNVAELRLLAERLTLLYSGLEIGPSKLPTEILDGAEAGDQPLKQKVVDLERHAIAQALLEAEGKKIRAAAILGISRPTLDKKIRDLHLAVEKRKGS